MRAVLAVLFFICVILFVWGLISPSHMSSSLRVKKQVKRRHTSFIFGFLALLFVILIGATLSKTVTPTMNLHSKNTASQTSYGHSNTTVKQVTETQAIAYTTVDQNNASISKGTAKITQYGQNGVETLVYNVIYANGQETNKSLVSTTVTTPPTNEIVEIGPAIPTNKATTKHQKQKCYITHNGICYQSENN